MRVMLAAAAALHLASGSPDLAIGDSIAVGVAAAAGLPSRAGEGLSPQQVLGLILALNPSALARKCVLLSSGASNNPKELGAVERQVRRLRAAGADVVLLGTADRAVSARLAAIASSTGAKFVELGSTDGLHPRSYPRLAGRSAVCP